MCFLKFLIFFKMLHFSRILPWSNRTQLKHFGAMNIFFPTGISVLLTAGMWHYSPWPLFTKSLAKPSNCAHCNNTCRHHKIIFGIKYKVYRNSFIGVRHAGFLQTKKNVPLFGSILPMGLLFFCYGGAHSLV